jgi:5-methylcytosine-specific restriction protein A
MTAEWRTVKPLEEKRVAPVGDKRIRGRRLIERNARLAWRKPLCAMCIAHGIVSVAAEWDHIIPLWANGLDDESNMQGLCKACHHEKTAYEAKVRGR